MSMYPGLSNPAVKSLFTSFRGRDPFVEETKKAVSDIDLELARLKAEMQGDVLEIRNGKQEPDRTVTTQSSKKAASGALPTVSEVNDDIRAYIGELDALMKKIKKQIQ